MALAGPGEAWCSIQKLDDGRGMRDTETCSMRGALVVL